MNIQIFGTKKSADTRKAERWFKERRISYQLVDMKEKGMSRGEFDNVLRAVGPHRRKCPRQADPHAPALPHGRSKARQGL